MFKYLILFGISFYLVLVTVGEDRGQQRMGLAGAYTVDAPPLAPPEDPAEAAPSLADAAPSVPADTIRILPVREPDATLQQASLSDTPADAPDTPSDTASVTLRSVTADAANVRDAASRTATVIGRLERGEVVQWLGQTGDWVHIRIEGDGIDGYVHRRLLSAEPPALTATTLFPAAD